MLCCGHINSYRNDTSAKSNSTTEFKTTKLWVNADNVLAANLLNVSFCFSRLKGAVTAYPLKTQVHAVYGCTLKFRQGAQARRLRIYRPLKDVPDYLSDSELLEIIDYTWSRPGGRAEKSFQSRMGVSDVPTLVIKELNTVLVRH